MPQLSEDTIIAGRYRLDRLVGEGGMGAVWAATHEVTRSRVALKFLQARVSHRSEMRRRFLAEARTASAIDHPNVIEVRDIFELEDGALVMVLDLLEGETLRQRLAAVGMLSLAQTAAVLLPVIDAVIAAHSLGVVHRDLKPGNVFLTSTDELVIPKVLDFGIAKLLEPDEDGVVTGTGALLGTPGYMAPEQGFGEKNVDARADVYSLGVMIYECLSGIRPVEAENLGQYLKRLMHDSVTPLAVVAPGVPAAISTLVMSMIDQTVQVHTRRSTACADLIKGEAIRFETNPAHWVCNARHSKRLGPK